MRAPNPSPPPMETTTPTPRTDEARAQAWAAWLRDRMDARGLSVRDVQEACGVKSTRTVQAWREGSDPGMKYGRRLARCLGVSALELLRRAEGEGV